MVSCGRKGVKLKLATCTVIKTPLGQLLVPSLHITSMALTYFTPWTDQARQLLQILFRTFTETLEV